MDIKNLETFLMVAELKSFTQAAQKLGFTQSTVSFQIKQLEDELQAQLFERINRTVTLTNEGEKLLPICHEIIKLEAEAHHISGDSDEPAGIVRIAIAESLSNWQFSKRFREFHNKYPGIRLKVIAASTDDMFQMLDQNQVDLVYTLDREICDHRYKIAFEAPVAIYFAAKKGYERKKKGNMVLEDLLEEPLILTEKDMSYRAVLDEVLARRGKESRPVMEVGDTHLICELLRQGIGISFLPEFVIEQDRAAGRLEIIEIEDFQLTICRQLIHHRNKWISPELQCVIQELKKM